MSGVNKVMVMGNVGRRPERRVTQSGQTVVNFSLCVNERLAAGKEKATWLSIVAWGNVGEACAQYLDKGSAVFVEGRLDVRTVENDQGQRRTFTDIVAHNVQFLSRPKQQRPEDDDSFGAAPTFAGSDEDVPF